MDSPGTRQRRRLEAHLGLCFCAVSLGCVAFCAFVVAPGVNIVAVPDAQGRVAFLGWVALASAPLLAALTYAAHRRSFGTLRGYLDARPAEVLPAELLRDAFSRSVAYPQRAFGYCLLVFPVGGLLLASAGTLRFQAWGATSFFLVVMGFAIVGWLAGMLVFLLHKRLLGPVRHALAAEIPDPGEREALIRPLSLGRKLLLMSSGLTVLTAFATLAIAMGRASDVVKAFAMERHPIYLEAIRADGRLRGDLEAATRLAAERYAPSGLRFSVLEPDGSDLSELDGVLTPREQEILRPRLPTASAPGPENSLAIDSPNHFSWAYLAEFDRVLVITTPESVVDPDLDAVGAGIGGIAFIVVLLGLALAGLGRQDLQQIVDVLQANFRRVADGDLGGGERLESEDELAVLVRSAEVMERSLRGTVARVVAAADDLDDAACEMAGASDRAASISQAQVASIGRVTESTERVRTRAEDVSRSATDMRLSVDRSSASLGRLGSIARQLDQNASLLSARADEASESTRETIESADQLGEQTRALAHRVRDASQSMAGLLEAARAIDTHARDSADFAEQVSRASDQGSDRVARTISGMDEIRAITGELRTAIDALHGQAGDIGGVLDVIDEVSDQTRLLALNAAIVAAQSREGAFAVVASQMRELADRVSARTQEIAEIVKGLQAHSAHASGLVERGVTRVSEGVALSQEAGIALEQISSTARESGTRCTTIVSAATEQTRTTEGILGLLREILEGFESISRAGEAQRRRGETALEGARDVTAIAREVHESAEAQSRSARRLHDAMDAVRRASELIEAALREQSTATDEAARSLTAMLDEMRANEASAEKLRESGRSLVARAETLREHVDGFRTGSQEGTAARPQEA